MAVHASIARRSLRITGSPNGGWATAQPDDPASRELPFRFAITDDGDGGFLLDFASLNGVFRADYHYSSLDDAFEGARECFDIRQEDWTRRDARRG